LYTDELKYSGVSDNFDYKFKIFLDYCEQAGLLEDSLAGAISYMLRGQALDYYFICKFRSQGNHSIEDITKVIKNYFEGPEHQINVLQQWNGTSLQSTMDSNPNQTYTQNLDLLIQTLRKLNHGLAPELQIDKFTHNKLIIACEAILVFHLACRKPAPTVTGLISDLRATAASYDRLHPSIKSDTLFTDRKYHGNRNTSRYPPSN
jgi:hypothetical protein